MVTVPRLPHHAEGGVEQYQNKLEAEDGVEHVVHLDHNIAYFLRGFLSIHHNLRLFAHVNYKAYAIVDVSEVAPS